MKRLFALVCALFLLSIPGFAHPGKTDGSGGHYNRSTGEYHFHHGYSAHQHPDGVCPYDFKDKTDHSSGSSTSPKSTTLRNSAFDEFFYCNGHPRHRHEDGVCPWAEIDAAPKPTYYLSNEAFVAGSWVSKTPQPTTLPAASTKFKGDDRVNSTIAWIISVLLLISLLVTRHKKTKELRALTKQRDEAVALCSTYKRREEEALVRETTFLNSIHHITKDVHINMRFLDYAHGFVDPDLSDGVVYISKDLSGKKYHHAWQCLSNGILASKVRVLELGYTPCDCCTLTSQPESDISVEVSWSNRRIYHSRHCACLHNERLIPLSQAQAEGRRPCMKCKPPVENPYIWF